MAFGPGELKISKARKWPKSVVGNYKNDTEIITFAELEGRWHWFGFDCVCGTKNMGKAFAFPIFFVAEGLE